ncbi:hypothetical protein AB4Z17_02085 [Paenibacillus sp. TAF43_2]|uniref:hypothetical protein n=1 Tax=Paenibacillus sp. TAF43_2 TaxID=3233069 RepID=UPI003F98BE47
MLVKRFIGLLLFLAVLFLASCSENTVAETDLSNINVQEIVATVNGEPIRYGELSIMMQRKRSDAVRYFYDNYQAEDSANYWTTIYGKEKPMDWLKAAALDEAVQIKMQQIIAKNEGIVQRIDYIDFRENWVLENNRRKKAAEQKQLIYGPLQYEENAYYEYVFSNMVLQYKEKQRERSGLTVDEAERLYKGQLEQKLSTAVEVIEHAVYDRIQNP